jgi:cell division protease FtsH
MSDKLGPIHYSANQEEVFLGHSVTQTKNLSDETASVVDSEIRMIVESAYARATDVLTKHIDQLHSVAKALLEYETLSGDEIKGLLRGEPIIRAADDEPQNKGPRSSVPSSTGFDETGDPKTQGV